jgi:deaminated glutathione amidase
MRLQGVGVTGVRVAAAQFAVGLDVAENLATCLRMIDAATARDAEVVVLPAFLNHPPWYTDREHAERVACRPGDGFLAALAASAASHQVYLKAHVSLADEGRVTAAHLLFDGDGELAGWSAAQYLPGPERRWLDAAREPGPVIGTGRARFGMYGSDGLVAEFPRALALRGAQVMLVSLSSITTDDARLHVPVRAAENKTWVVAANTVGPQPGAQTYDVPAEWLVGAGESSIVGPDGSVVVHAPRTGEAIVVTDIEPLWADDKTRPDGTDIFLARRPRLYSPDVRPGPRRSAAERATAVVVRPRSNGMSAIEEAADLVHSASRNADLVVLPELFFYPHGRADGSFLDGIAVDMLAQALSGTACHAVTSLPDDGAHLGVLISGNGVRGSQVQMHPCTRHVAWQAVLGDRLIPFDLGWGRLVIVVGDDSLYPETFTLAALVGADAVALPCAPAERWELTFGLPQRTAEHRINIVAAAHAGPGGGGAIVVPVPDSALHRGRVGGFTGRLSQPQITPVGAAARSTLAAIFPMRAREPGGPVDGTPALNAHPSVPRLPERA